MLLESVKRKEKSLRWEGFVNRQVLSLQGKSERVVDVDGAWWINRRWCDRHRKWRSVFTARCYASAVLAMGLCPSVSVSVSVCVCLSVTSRCSTKTAKHRITQTTLHDTTGTLVFCCQRSPRNSTEVTLYEGTECRWVGQNRRLSTYIRLYLEKGKR